MSPQPTRQPIKNKISQSNRLPVSAKKKFSVWLKKQNSIKNKTRLQKTRSRLKMMPTFSYIKLQNKLINSRLDLKIKTLSLLQNHFSTTERFTLDKAIDSLRIAITKGDSADIRNSAIDLQKVSGDLSKKYYK